MRNRKGVVFVAFDLPTSTTGQRKIYRKFRSFLIKSGYIMFQESLYYKVIKNTIHSAKEINEVSLHSPEEGNIIALPLTFNEIYKLKNIRGNGINMDEFTEEVFFY